MREVVRDPQVADLRAPDHPIGTKRLCADTGYYPAFNRADARAQHEWREHVDEVANRSLMASSASWYTGHGRQRPRGAGRQSLD